MILFYQIVIRTKLKIGRDIYLRKRLIIIKRLKEEIYILTTMTNEYFNCRADFEYNGVIGTVITWCDLVFIGPMER